MLNTKYNTAYSYAYNHGGFVDCKYNEHIDCINGAECKSCGWNPKVAKKRKSQLFKRKVGQNE